MENYYNFQLDNFKISPLALIAMRYGFGQAAAPAPQPYDWRDNRPSYLDDPENKFAHAGTMARPLPPVDPNLPPKDWSGKQSGFTPPPKDWSKLGL